MEYSLGTCSMLNYCTSGKYEKYLNIKYCFHLRINTVFHEITFPLPAPFQVYGWLWAL